MKIAQKEITIFLITFLFLALVMHFNAWIDHPIQHINSLSSSSLGTWHPIVISFLVYMVVCVGRGLISLWKKIIKNKGKEE